MLTRVSSQNPQDPQNPQNPQDPQDPQDASFRACTTASYVERTFQTEWVLESDVYDNDTLELECFMLLVVLTFSVPLCSFLYFAYANHAVAEV